MLETRMNARRFFASSNKIHPYFVALADFVLRLS